MGRAIMRMAPALAFLFFVAGLIGSVARADSKGHVNFILGEKAMDNDWEPNDSQKEVGIDVTWGPSDWPIAFATDVYGASASANILGFEVNDQSSELAFGVRKIWEAGPARPYIGGGVAKLAVEREVNNDTDDDSTLGGWIGGGIFWRLGSRFNIGFAARISRGEVTLMSSGTPQKTEAGGSHAGLILGWGWPAGK
jgi:hypothetical protein